MMDMDIDPALAPEVFKAIRDWADKQIAQSGKAEEPGVEESEIEEEPEAKSQAMEDMGDMGDVMEKPSKKPMMTVFERLDVLPSKMKKKEEAPPPQSKPAGRRRF